MTSRVYTGYIFLQFCQFLRVCAVGVVLMLCLLVDVCRVVRTPGGHRPRKPLWYVCSAVSSMPMVAAKSWDHSPIEVAETVQCCYHKVLQANTENIDD